MVCHAILGPQIRQIVAVRSALDLLKVCRANGSVLRPKLRSPSPDLRSSPLVIAGLGAGVRQVALTYLVGRCASVLIERPRRWLSLLFFPFTIFGRAYKFV